MKLIIPKEKVVPLFESRFIKVFDLQYEEGKHYYDASRRDLENLVATKSAEEFRIMLPDAVTCVVVVKEADGIPRLLLSKEYRYPAGQFLLNPPAGLLDPEDLCIGSAGLASPANAVQDQAGLSVSSDATDQQNVLADPAVTATDAIRETVVLSAARREIQEETGLLLKDTDTLYMFNPLLFSSPGMTDESNAFVCAIVDLDDPARLSQEGAVGTELFDGFELLTEEETRHFLETGRDRDGFFYSLSTWVAMMYFVSGLWKQWQ